MRLVVAADVRGPRNYHVGDEAMLEANLRALRQIAPDLEFTVLSGDPESTGRFYRTGSLATPCIPQGHTAGSWTRRMVEAGSPCAWAEWMGEEITAAVRASSGLFVSGGGNMSATWPERLLERVALIELASEAGLPAVVSGQTLGPALTPDQRQLLSRAFPKLRWLGVRDAESAALAHDLGVAPGLIHRQIDDAFFLEALPVTDTRADFLGEKSGRWIAVTLDASFAAPERAPSLAALASQLDALAGSLDARLVFVPHVGGEDAGDGASDAVAGRALAAQLHASMAVLDPWQPREVRWLMDRVALVVSTRYHPLVFASAAATPAFGIWTDEYTRIKLRGALAPAGLEGWCVPIAHAGRGGFLPLALGLWRCRDAVRERLVRLRAEARSWEAGRWEGISRVLGLTPGTGLAEESPQPPAISIAPCAPLPFRAPRLLTGEQWSRYERDGYLRLGRLLDARWEGGSVCPQLLFDLLGRDLLREICARVYGAQTNISVLIEEREGQSDWQHLAGMTGHLDRDPLVTLWVALEPSTRANGCLEVIPGTHSPGLPATAEAARQVPGDAIESLELEAGEAVVLHNRLPPRGRATPA